MVAKALLSVMLIASVTSAVSPLGTEHLCQSPYTPADSITVGFSYYGPTGCTGTEYSSNGRTWDKLGCLESGYTSITSHSNRGADGNCSAPTSIPIQGQVVHRS